nr:hypothetical protein [Tanacetum cinerariifolium]
MFYNGLTEQDQDFLNAALGGNLLNKTTREALQIIENKSKISNLVEIVNKQVIAPAKAVEKTCVTYGGAHAYYECIATDSNPSSVCTATGSYNQLSLPNRASHQISPPGFALVQNNPNRFNQIQSQGNYFNRANNFNQENNFRGNNFQNNQGYHAQMNNVLNFQNQGFQNQPFSVPNNQIPPSVPNEFSSYIKSNEIAIKSMQNQINVLRGDFCKQEENLRRNLNDDMRNNLSSFFQNQPITSACDKASWNKFIFVVFDYRHTSFLGYTVDRTYPRAVRNRYVASNSGEIGSSLIAIKASASSKSRKSLSLNGNPNSTASTFNPSAEQIETLTVESPIPTVSSPVPTACLNDSSETSSEARIVLKRVPTQEETPSLDNILSLTNRVANQVKTPSLDNILTLANRFEDILGATKNSDESNGVEADVTNMETTITASPTPTLRIHKDHPKSQIIGPVDTPIQTRNKSKE